MYVMASQSGKKTWQTRRQRVSVEAALAIQRENVTNRLTRLREEIGHPEKPGKPLPQDQAAAKAGVTVRQWQRWESGESIPYARNLSEVADAFGFDVGEFYDGPAGQKPAETPTPFANGHTGTEGALLEVLSKINARLDDQDRILNEIREEQAALRALIAEQKQLKAETDELWPLMRAIAEGHPPVDQPASSGTRRRTARAKK